MLEGKLIRLRALEPADVDKLYLWENNSDIWPVSNTNVPFSRHILEQFVLSGQDFYATRQLRLMITDIEKNCIGCLDFFEFDPKNLRAGVGILIADESNRKKGYATEAIELAKNYMFEQFGLVQLYCNIAANNADSLRLFKNAGFEISGIKKKWTRSQGAWLDEYFLQVFRPN